MRYSLSRPIAVGTLDDLPTFFFVYMIGDENQNVIYVGFTKNVRRRVGDHRQTAEWGHRIRGVVWEQYTAEADARARERFLIQRLRPEFNVVDKPSGPRRAPISLPSVRHRDLTDEAKQRRAIAAARHLSFGDRF